MTTQQPYRGIDIKTEEWVYGWKCVWQGITLIFDSPYNLLHNPVEVHPDSVSQSTGKEDRHGVEIYGGMSLRSCTSSTRTLLVSWSDERCAFVVSDGFNENLLSDWNTKTFEIIPDGEPK